MNVGPLDRRILIKKKSVTPDPDYGSDVVTWVNLIPTGDGKLWANVQDELPSRSERVTVGSLEVSILPVRIRIRWRADVDSAMRIEITYPSPRVLQIVSGPVDIGGRKAFLEMMCEEVTS